MTLPADTQGQNAEMDPQLAGLLAEAAQKLQTGEPVDVDDYARRYPEYAQRLRQLIPEMKTLAELGHSRSSVPSSIAGADRILTESQGELGDFRILREIGRGGMGIVYEAEQVSLNRRVALKVLPFAVVMDPRHLQRFKNEAQAAASLKHPNIVGIYSVGCERGVHYYAMEYVEGQTLAQVIDDLRRLSGQNEKRFAYPTKAGVLICDAETGHPVLPELECEDEPRSLAWSPDGTILAVGVQKKTPALPSHTSGRVVLISATSGKRVAASAYVEWPCDWVAWRPDGKRLAASGKQLRVWNSTLREELRVPTTPAVCQAWSPDGKQFAVTDGVGPSAGGPNQDLRRNLLGSNHRPCESTLRASNVPRLASALATPCHGRRMGDDHDLGYVHRSRSVLAGTAHQDVF